MLLGRRHHPSLAAGTGVWCWLAMIVVASAQIDFRAGSLLDAPPAAEMPMPSVVPQPIEPLPATFGSPLAADGPFATPANNGFVPPFANPDFLYHFGGKARGYYINDQRIEFTGMEDTFAVEGVLDGGVLQR